MSDKTQPAREPTQWPGIYRQTVVDLTDADGQSVTLTMEPGDFEFSGAVRPESSQPRWPSLGEIEPNRAQRRQAARDALRRRKGRRNVRGG